MRYRLLKHDGKYAIERTFSIMGFFMFTVHRERLHFPDCEYWWGERQTKYWVKYCWTEDGALAIRHYDRLTGSVELISESIA
jgi:hypothetical protein